MSNTNLIRIYVDKSLKHNEEIILINNHHHYLKNVMRIKKGEHISIFNGKDGEWSAKIVKISKSSIITTIDDKLMDQNISPDIWLIFAPIKKDKLNILVQKCTELGVRKFIPIISERTNVKNINISNLRKNAIESAEQCMRLDIPEIEKEIKLENYFNNWPNDRCILFCDEQNLKGIGLVKQLNIIKNKFSKWGIIIGPEGGLTKKERKSILKLTNIFPVSLGSRILKSDTAATVSLYCIQEIVDN